LNVCLRQLGRMDEAIFLSKTYISNCIMKNQRGVKLHQETEEDDKTGNLKT
jgi:hypothetical protein